MAAACSHLQPPGVLGASLVLAGQRMQLPPLFFLSLFGTIGDFYQAGVYLVCFVVGAAAGVSLYSQREGLAPMFPAGFGDQVSGIRDRFRVFVGAPRGVRL